MSRRTPFDYDVSVSADKRRRTRRRAAAGGAFEGLGRTCEAEGCERRGEYRAPRSPDRLQEFRWFCLDHVREYNRAWNFFEGQDEDAFAAFMDSDRVWGRHTWRFGSSDGKPRADAHEEGRSWARFGFRDPFEVLGENATRNPGAAAADEAARGRAEAVRRRLPPNERRAVDILGAPEDARREDLRRRYRALVKDLHPDMNGGRRDEEARLREVLWAWEQVKESRRFRD